MDALTRLVEEEAIKRVKARYFRCMDTEDWEGFVSVFTDDIEFTLDLAVGVGGVEVGEPTIMRGKRQMYESVATTHGRVRRCHHGHMPEIDILSDTEARGIWAMEDRVVHGETTFRGAGHYHETYRKEDGHWLIATVHLKRIYLQQTTYDRMML